MTKLQTVRTTCLAVLFLGITSGQSPLSVQTAYAKETVVSGTAALGSGPITVMDVQFPAAVKLGTGNIAPDGTFAVSVQAPLVAGHALVAVDKSGRTSARFNVTQARSGDTPGAPPPK